MVSLPAFRLVMRFPMIEQLAQFIFGFFEDVLLGFGQIPAGPVYIEVEH